jgi:hypothetical protein
MINPMNINVSESDIGTDANDLQKNSSPIKLNPSNLSKKQKCPI